jgi:hypothetical protein
MTKTEIRKRNVIFLDFNGVLETLYCATQNVFDPYCVEQLKSMVDDKTDIVVTSNWRVGKTLTDIQTLFKPYGIKIFSVTPVLPYQTREDEIEKFIEDAPRKNGIIVDKYIVLDDDDEYYTLTDHVFKTNYKTGITHEISQCAIKYMQ